MAIDRDTRTRARRALGEALPWIHDPNVTLIDFGQGRVGGRIVEEKLAIRFHVRRKLARAALQGAIEAGRTERVPETIGDFPTDVLEGSFRPHRLASWWWGRGGSLSHGAHDTYDSLGGLEVDRETGERMILSNWRILPADWSPRVSPRIHSLVLSGNGPQGGEPLGLGTVRVGQAEIGMEVVRSGGRSGITCGVVRGVEGIARVSYASRDQVIRDVVTIESRTSGEEPIAPGDSGSLWLDRASLGVIGLHFAGSNSPGRLAVAMTPVADSRGVDIAIEHRGVAAVLRRVSIPV